MVKRLALLFLIATVLTLRLIYMQNPQSSLSDLILSDTSDKKIDIDPTFFDKLNSMVENSVKLVDDKKSSEEEREIFFILTFDIWKKFSHYYTYSLPFSPVEY
uniref:Uncharacterized protein n=1 Tax=Romanomermis culicivorax TaxID=13658 RepID=A0A915JGA0_ROMCU